MQMSSLGLKYSNYLCKKKLVTKRMEETIKVVLNASSWESNVLSQETIRERPEA